MLFQAQARDARSGPMLTAQTSSTLGIGFAWKGCMRSDDAELGEARDVGGADRFDVLDAVAPAAGRRRVRLRRPLVGVEGHPDARVADGVDEDLPARASIMATMRSRSSTV